MGIGAAVASHFFLGSAVAIAATGFLIDLAITYVISSVLTRPGRSRELVSDAAARKATIKSAVSPRTIIYGQGRYGGAVIFENNTNNNKTKNFIIAHCSHEVESFDGVYFDDELVTVNPDGSVTTFKYTDPELGISYVKVLHANGTDDQAAMTQIVSDNPGKWGTLHKLSGIAYTYVSWTVADKVAATHQVPKVTVHIKGKRVWNLVSGQREWSDNPAWCLRDYLIDHDDISPQGSSSGCRYGMRLAPEDLNEASFIAAGNICDEEVPLKAGGSEKRYTCNGSISTSRRHGEAIEEILSSMAGELVPGGEFFVYAGKWKPPVAGFNEDHLRRPLKVVTALPAKERANSVKGVYISPEDSYEPTDFPARSVSSYYVEDDEILHWLDVQLPFTNSHQTAQRIALQMLHRRRMDIAVEAAFNLRGLRIKAGDVITLSNDRLGWSGKTFEVISWTINPDPEDIGVNCALREVDPTAYDWVSGTDELTYSTPLANDLADPENCSPPSNFDAYMVFQINETGEVTSTGIKMTWTEPIDTFVRFYDVQIRIPEESSEYVSVAQPRQGQMDFTIWDLDYLETYDVQMQTVNLYDKRSSFVGEEDVNNQDQNEPPFVCLPPTFNVIREDPIELADGTVIFNVKLRWSPDPADPYAAEVEIRYEDTSNLGEYINVGSFNFEVPEFIVENLDPNKTYRFWIRCISYKGIKSPWVTETGNPKSDDPLAITGLTIINDDDWSEGIQIDWDDVWDNPNYTKKRKRFSHYYLKEGGSNFNNATRVRRRRASDYTYKLKRITKRTYTFRVKAVMKTGKQSEVDAVLTVKNKAPKIPNAARVTASNGFITIKGMRQNRTGAQRWQATAHLTPIFSGAVFLGESASDSLTVPAPPEFIERVVYVRLMAWDELTEQLNESPAFSSFIPIYVPAIGTETICRSNTGSCEPIEEILEGLDSGGTPNQKFFQMFMAGNVTGIQSVAAVLRAVPNGSKAKIEIAAHEVHFPWGKVSYNAGAITVGYDKGYAVYADDPNFAGGSPGYVAVSLRKKVTQSEGRYFLGTVFTPANAQDEPSYGGGGAGGGSIFDERQIS